MNGSAKHIEAFVQACTGTVATEGDGMRQVEEGLNSLVASLDGSPFFIEAHPLIVSDYGTPRISFSAYAPKGVVVKQRTMHPVHAAITRTIELAGGRIKLHQPDPDANYQLRLQLDGIGTTNLTRILFNAGRSRDLMERKGSDYHDIVPANFTLRIGPDRVDVLDALRPRGELAELLRRLFLVADERHGKDLTQTR